MNALAANLSALRELYPDIASRIDMLDPGSVDVAPTPDGGIAYYKNLNGQRAPLTNPSSPLAGINAQLAKNSASLQDYSRPVLIVGLYPGVELTYIFDLSENAPGQHASQHIYVCIDSAECLCGYLQTSDLTRIIRSERVHLFWHEDTESLTGEIAEHPEMPHIFTFITGCTNGTLNSVMPHFARLISMRDREMADLIAENNSYYNSISDTELSDILSNNEGAGRRPRLLMPTTSWSTVTQYSAKDTCKAFEDDGWETLCLNMEQMITPYYIVKTINEFKPDLLLFINHLRTEASEVYPDRMMFASWIQDSIPSIINEETAAVWNRTTDNRNLIIGYTDQLMRCGFDNRFLEPVNMIVNRESFAPSGSGSSYDCDICFASNRSKSSEAIVSEELVTMLADLDIGEKLLMALNEHLWHYYRSGRTLITPEQLKTELSYIDEFASAFNSLKPAEGKRAIDTLFWKLNDTVYRHVVLEWCKEMGAEMNLYGEGWESSPALSQFARGRIAHGNELSTAYQKARFCLHLNSTEGMHQRIHEILASNARLLTRTSKVLPESELITAMHKIEPLLYSSNAQIERLDDLEKAALLKKLSRVLADYRAPHSPEARILSGTVSEKEYIISLFKELKNFEPAYSIDHWAQMIFSSRNSLETLLKEDNSPLTSSDFEPPTRNICELLSGKLTAILSPADEECSTILDNLITEASDLAQTMSRDDPEQPLFGLLHEVEKASRLPSKELARKMIPNETLMSPPEHEGNIIDWCMINSTLGMHGRIYSARDEIIESGHNTAIFLAAISALTLWQLDDFRSFAARLDDNTFAVIKLYSYIVRAIAAPIELPEELKNFAPNSYSQIPLSILLRECGEKERAVELISPAAHDKPYWALNDAATMLMAGRDSDADEILEKTFHLNLSELTRETASDCLNQALEHSSWHSLSPHFDFVHNMLLIQLLHHREENPLSKQAAGWYSSNAPAWQKLPEGVYLPSTDYIYTFIHGDGAV